MPTVAQDTQANIDLKNDTYHIMLIARNFNFTVIDINHKTTLMNQGVSEAQAINQSSFVGNLTNLAYGKTLLIEAKSAQDEHGFFIEKLGVEFDLKGPGNNETYGPTSTKTTTLPTTDVTMRAYCNIFCGVGHDTMAFYISVGHGSSYSGNGWEIFLNPYVIGLGVIFVVVSYAIYWMGVIREPPSEDDA